VVPDVSKERSVFMCSFCVLISARSESVVGSFVCDETFRVGVNKHTTPVLMYLFTAACFDCNLNYQL
jgi:hypothetical protein